MKDLTYTKEIIDKTAADLNMTPQTVNYLYNFMIEYLHTTLNNTDCCSFFLPNLGYLYVDANYIDKMIAATEVENKTTEIRKKNLVYKYKRKALDIYLKEIKKTDKEKEWSYHYYKDSFEDPELTGGRTKEEMQYFQNRVYEDLANNKE